MKPQKNRRRKLVGTFSRRMTFVSRKALFFKLVRPPKTSKIAELVVALIHFSFHTTEVLPPPVSVHEHLT